MDADVNCNADSETIGSTFTHVTRRNRGILLFGRTELLSFLTRVISQICLN